MTTEKQPTVASMQPFVIQRCDTCHWWTDAMGALEGRKACVWHTGSRDAKTRKVDFGGNKSLRTTADFGCVCWEKDMRNKSG